MSKRFVTPLGTSTRPHEPGSPIYIHDPGERSRGVVAGCYARVYLDDALLNPTSPADPVDLSTFTAKGIKAIEYYDGASQTPNQYARLNSNCGMLVIHTRRSP